MNQLNLFSKSEMRTSTEVDVALLILSADTDSSWLEVAFPVWDDPVMLGYYRADLEARLKDETAVGVSSRPDWVGNMLHDVRDTIRVISERINALQH